MTQPVKHQAVGLPPRGTSSGAASDRAEKARQPEPTGQQSQVLRGPCEPGERDEDRMDGKDQPVADPLSYALRARRRRSPFVERRPGRFHEMSELDRRRTRGLTTTTLHAFVHRDFERGVDRPAFELDEAHRRDATPRRCDLESGDAIGGTVGQTQSTRDARGELVRVEIERPARAVHRGRRPGASLRAGSKASLTRRINSAFGNGRPKPSISCAPASRNNQPS